MTTELWASGKGPLEKKRAAPKVGRSGRRARPSGSACRRLAVEIELGAPQHIGLTEFVADKGPVGECVAERHGLEPHAYEELARWPFGDFVFASEYDIMSDTSKARRHGFHDVVDTEEMFRRIFAEFRAARVIP